MARLARTEESSIGSFVGRQEELALLQRLVDAAQQGRGAAVTITGEHGIGKTRLVREAVVGVTDRASMTVLWGQGYAEGGAPSYWPWAEIIGELVRVSGAAELFAGLGSEATYLARIVPAVRELIPPDEDVTESGGSESRFRLFAAVRRLLETASSRKPLLIVLDDLQYCDPATLLLLEAVAREVDRHSVAIIGTYSGSVPPTSSLAVTLGELAKLPWYHSIRLRPFDGRETATLLSELFDPGVAAALAETALARTEGNPLFVVEALRLLEYRTDVTADEAIRVWEEELPVKAGVVVGARLSRVPQLCRQMVGIAAVLGGEAPVEVLSIVAETEEADASAALEPAISTGLLSELADGKLVFPHELIRMGILDGMSTGERRRLHGRCGVVLEELRRTGRTISAATLAYHYSRAESSLKDRVALYSREAGEDALQSYAFESALAHFESAASTDTLGPVERADLAMLEALALAWLGEMTRSSQKVAVAFQIFVDQGETERAVDAAVFDTFPGLLDYVGETLKETRERALNMVPPESPQAAQLLCELGKAYAFESYEQAATALDRSLEIATGLDRPDLVVRALQYRAVLERRHLHYPSCVEIGERAVEMTRQSGDEGLLMLRGGLVAGWALMHGDRSFAERRVTELMSLPEARRVRVWHRELQRLRLRLTVFQGQWEEARRLLSPVVSSGGIAGMGALIDAETGRGDVDEVLREAADTDSWAMRNAPLVDAPSLYRLAHISRITGRHAYLAVIRDRGSLVLAREGSVWMRAHALIGLGLEAWIRSDLETLERLCGSELAEPPNQMLTIGIGSLDRLRGLFAGALGRDAQARDYFESALTFCRNARFGPELAWTCLDYGSFLAGRGERTRARTLIQEGLALAEKLAMVPLGRELRRLMNRQKGEAPDGLTQRELEVLGLAAAGQSNQEIAAALFISYHTVVNHVRHIYEKTGIRGRVELAQYARRNGIDPGPDV